MSNQRLLRLEKFFDHNNLGVVYREVELSSNEKHQKLSVFTENKLDFLDLTLIEMAFEIKVDFYMVPNKKWITQSNVRFKPIKVKKFNILSSFYSKKEILDRYSIIIDASLAFGTGHHWTTNLCLQLLQKLMIDKFCPSKIIDVGCGTGVLSIGAARLFKAKVIAVDSDLNAVLIAKKNTTINRVTQDVKVFMSDGLRKNFVSSYSKYDLIIANILYRPLKMLTKTFCQNLCPGGYVILSGVNIKQANHLKLISRHFNLAVIKELREKNWSGLLLKKIKSN